MCVCNAELWSKEITSRLKLSKSVRGDPCQKWRRKHCWQREGRTGMRKFVFLYWPNYQTCLASLLHCWFKMGFCIILSPSDRQYPKWKILSPGWDAQLLSFGQHLLPRENLYLRLEILFTQEAKTQFFCSCKINKTPWHTRCKEGLREWKGMWDQVCGAVSMQ